MVLCLRWRGAREPKGWSVVLRRYRLDIAPQRIVPKPRRLVALPPVKDAIMNSARTAEPACGQGRPARVVMIRVCEEGEGA